MSLTVALDRVWRRANVPMMGTIADVLVDGDAEHVAATFATLRDIEVRCSRFDPDSELNQLLRRPEEWVTVSEPLFAALRWSVRLWRETDGLFDPTVRSALEAWGYDVTFRKIAPPATAPDHAPAPGLGGVRLAAERLAVWIPAGVPIDLGGIGKGLAADRAAAAACHAGAAGAIVSIGGDMAVAGDVPNGGWHVPLVDPVDDRVLEHHPLSAGGIVMSTTALRRWKVGDVDVHHLVDPRTGRPADGDLRSDAVAAASAARAEAFAKAAIVAGRDHAREMLRRAGVRAWLIGEDRSVEHVESTEEDQPCWP